MLINTAFIVPIADIFIFGVVVFFAFYGFKRGALITLYDILRIYFSFIITLLFYEKLALILQAVLDISSAFARIICFTGVFVLFLAIMWTTGFILRKRISKPLESDSNMSKIGGTVLGLLEGALIVSIIIMDISFYPSSEESKSSLRNTISYKTIKQIAPAIETFTIRPISHLKDISDNSDAEGSKSDNP